MLNSLMIIYIEFKTTLRNHFSSIIIVVKILTTCYVGGYGNRGMLTYH